MSTPGSLTAFKHSRRSRLTSVGILHHVPSQHVASAQFAEAIKYETSSSGRTEQYEQYRRWPSTVSCILTLVQTCGRRTFRIARARRRNALSCRPRDIKCTQRKRTRAIPRRHRIQRQNGGPGGAHPYSVASSATSAFFLCTRTAEIHTRNTFPYTATLGTLSSCVVACAALRCLTPSCYRNHGFVVELLLRTPD